MPSRGGILRRFVLRSGWTWLGFAVLVALHGLLAWWFRPGPLLHALAVVVEICSAALALSVDRSVADTLPPIEKRYPPVVEPRWESGAVVAEIFSSTEKAGTGNDGCLVEIATAFNDRGLRTASGALAQARIRSIPSGTGYEYIAYRRAIPDGFTPSNHLWIQMVAASGVPVAPVSESLMGNTAGVVMKDAVFADLQRAYGTVDVRAVIDAVVAGKIAMGYTNPFASSTGLNFLVTVLATFEKGDERAMLSPEVASAFEAFQRGVPFAALTTMQRRESVERGGSLDAFIMEHQTYRGTSALASGWRFVPFGWPHRNPLYAVGDPPPEKLEVLRLFAEHARSPASRATAVKFGFDRDLAFQPFTTLPSGQLLVQAQKLWKEKKDVGRISAARPMLFVLTDGQTNRGYIYNQVSGVIEGLAVPVYTISYGDDVAELKRLSSLNEAANLKADPDDIAYQIGALLNAEM